MSISKIMESKKNLVIIGMMGSGKSTIGSLLSKKLRYDFIDIDKKIEKNEGLEILTIFKKKGEKYFRNIEEKISIELLNSEKKVISLGGGAFINKNIQKIVLKEHISFWLNWKSEILINRIKNNNKRPLANNLGREKLKNLIFERNKVYNKANYKIDCNNLYKDEIVEKIKKIYEKL